MLLKCITSVSLAAFCFQTVDPRQSSWMHQWSCTESLLEQCLINSSWELHQINNFGVVGTKIKILRFKGQRSKVTVTLLTVKNLWAEKSKKQSNTRTLQLLFDFAFAAVFIKKVTYILCHHWYYYRMSPALTLPTVMAERRRDDGKLEAVVAIRWAGATYCPVSYNVWHLFSVSLFVYRY